ncbi:MAG: RNA polymerase sigma factor [Planctomycetota bacterium]|jgi:RNA polymerase sigma-70 factor (ECF subfamily)
MARTHLDGLGARCPSTPEASVVADAARGDAGAWRSLVDKYSRRIFALALSRLGNHDDAEEITQSVLVSVSEHLSSGRYIEQDRFESWLFRIATNRIRDEARRRKRQAAPTDPSTLTHHTTTEKADNDLEQLRHAMRDLPEHDQTLLTLRYQAQLPFADIASILDKPLGTVLAQHHRALAKLRNSLTTDTP